MKVTTNPTKVKIKPLKKGKFYIRKVGLTQIKVARGNSTSTSHHLKITTSKTYSMTTKMTMPLIGLQITQSFASFVGNLGRTNSGTDALCVLNGPTLNVVAKTPQRIMFVIFVGIHRLFLFFLTYHFTLLLFYYAFLCIRGICNIICNFYLYP